MLQPEAALRHGLPICCAALTLLQLLIGVTPAGAQQVGGLPAFAPINPVAASRSGLYFQPYHDPRPSRHWELAFGLDYGTSIESNHRPDASFLLDSELLRLNFVAARDLSPGTFLQVEVPIGGAYGGFLDGFIDWYHNVMGIRVPERDRRPTNAFAYSIDLADGTDIEPSASTVHLGDIRLGFGVRHTRRQQTFVALTLPTSTAPDGYGRGVPSLAAIHTVRLPAGRLVYEGSAGLGYTPAHGDLADYQRELFASLSSGFRFRLWKTQSLFGNLFYHSPYYRDTELVALDHWQFSFDFGWILATEGGEWRLGLTEDLEPSGPGIDLIVRFGRAF